MIAIIGGGWYGCHIARALKLRSIQFELFEAKERLFEGASGYNQNRLHLGFHYPRSAATRRQSLAGFHEFVQTYPRLSAAIDENIYAVVQDESLVDFDTYELVMRNSFLAFERRSPSDFGLVNVEGCLACGERVILTANARRYFTEALAGCLRLGCAFEDSPKYDIILNCTYQGWRPIPGANLRYEPCATLVYETSEKRAITLMDGQLFSAYPFERGTCTLYSVKYSRLAECDRYEFAANILNDEDSDEISWLAQKMEAGISHYYPAFRDLYRFAGWHGSIRGISTEPSDTRACRIVRDGRMVHVMPGKIDGIFHAEREVLRCLDCC